MTKYRWCYLYNSVYILNYTCLKGIHFSLEYPELFSKAEAKLPPHTISTHPRPTMLSCVLELSVCQTSSPFLLGWNLLFHSPLVRKIYHERLSQYHFVSPLSVGWVFPSCFKVCRHVIPFRFGLPLSTAVEPQPPISDVVEGAQGGPQLQQSSSWLQPLLFAKFISAGFKFYSWPPHTGSRGDMGLNTVVCTQCSFGLSPKVFLNVPL